MRPTSSATLLVRGTLMSGFLALSAQTVAAQKVVPVRELSSVDAKTTEHFGAILGLRPLKNGGVLVNDGARRQLVTLDQTLQKRNVVVDSVTEGGQSYGPRASPMIPYLADSSLFVDGTALSLLVLDPTGKIARVMSAPKPGDLRFLAGSASGVDAQGNLVYRGALQIIRQGPPPGTAPGAAPAAVQPPDSSPIVRANFETRSVDTVGRVKIQSGTKMNSSIVDGKLNMTMTINPLSTIDEWAVLSDGTIAFVRGHDYSVDMIRPDGKAFSSGKLPFDWKRLTDEDKQALIDSARTAQEKQMADQKAAAANPGGMAAKAAGMDAAAAGGMEVRMMVVGGSDGGRGGGGGVSMNGGGGGGNAMSFSSNGPPGAPGSFTPKIEFVPLKEIADYYPAIRTGAAKADLDGNLWILPTTSAQAKAGELVYDVVNNKGELFQRVRLPVGRSIAGFGHNGVVYLMYRDGTAGWFLERTKILNNTRAAEY